MNKGTFRKFVDALRGRTGANDWDSYKLALAEGIVGHLKDNDFIVKANCLVIGCESGCYEEALEESKSTIIKHLKNQGGSMRSLAERIGKRDGIRIQISPSPDGVDEKIIPASALPVPVWFYLEKKKDTTTSLLISRMDWNVTLEPGKRYTLGRSAESRDTTEMITLPDAGKSVSRWQAVIVCIDGAWYCKSISEKCPTFVNDRFADGDVLFPLGAGKGGQIKFGMGASGYVLYYGSNEIS